MITGSESKTERTDIRTRASVKRLLQDAAGNHFMSIATSIQAPSTPFNCF